MSCPNAIFAVELLGPTELFDGWQRAVPNGLGRPPCDAFGIAGRALLRPACRWSIAAALAALFALPSYALSAHSPHIVLIMPDDMGWGDIGAHGNPLIKTPNLDRLHAESLRFTDFHVSPTCSPTRSALLTGRHEFKNGVTHTILERERMTLRATTLAQVLKRAGYTTGIFGKWHLGDEEPYQPHNRGFDEVYIHGAGGIGQTYPGSGGDAPHNKYFDPAIRHNGMFVKTKGYCTDLFFTQAIKWKVAASRRCWKIPTHRGPTARW